MKDGYYLSVYAFVNPRPNIFLNSIYGCRHSCNMSLWKKEKEKIQLVEYCELERYSGEKQHSFGFHDMEQAQTFIKAFLAKRGLNLSDICDIWGTPPLSTAANTLLEPHKSFSVHTISHLFSVLLSDTEKFYNEKILAMAPDGGPDTTFDCNALRKHYFSGAYSDRGEIHIFPIASPGKIWAYLSSFWQLREGTMMALAYASTSRFITAVPDPVLPIYNGAVNVDEVEKLFRYFLFIKQREYRVRETNTGYEHYDSRFTLDENICSMTMKQIQEMSLQIMCNNIDREIERFSVDPKETYLAMSGGYALNCPTNAYLMNKYHFKGFIGIPCPDDSGQSLGIALYQFYKNMPKLDFKLKHAYYGYENENIEELLKNPEFAPFIDEMQPYSVERAVEDICAMPVVWVNGPAEIGPRSLGNRSILGDPRNMETKDFLNRVKQRQWWRPVAPVVLYEDMDDWFENAAESPFMLSVFRVRDECLSKVPAIAHNDSSARVQTVSHSDNEDLYELLTAFKRKTGIPLLCNTSLNDKGEPIINTKEQALNFALRKRIPVVYINKIRISLKNFEGYSCCKPLERELKVSDAAKSQLKMSGMDLVDPYKVDEKIYSEVLNSGMLREYDLSQNSQMRELSKKIYDMIQDAEK